MAAGKDLKRIREASNLSAEAFGKMIGVSADRLRKWEQKDFAPRKDDSDKIEKFFGVSITDLHKIKRVPLVPKLQNILEDDETNYQRSDSELVKSLRETIESQKKVIAFLEYQLKQYMPKEGRDLFDIEKDAVLKKS